MLLIWLVDVSIYDWSLNWGCVWIHQMIMWDFVSFYMFLDAIFTSVIRDYNMGYNKKRVITWCKCILYKTLYHYWNLEVLTNFWWICIVFFPLKQHLFVSLSYLSPKETYLSICIILVLHIFTCHQANIFHELFILVFRLLMKSLRSTLGFL